MCGVSFEPSGWTGLCGRGCYYDLNGLFMDYEHDRTGEVELDPRVISYLQRFPDPDNSHAPFESDAPRVYERFRAYLHTLHGDAEEYEADEMLCTMCGRNASGSGWTDLCSRSCYYDLRELLSAYETGAVDVPDERVSAYFRANPDGGGHWFVPDRILLYNSGHSAAAGIGAAAAGGGAPVVGEYTAKWNALAARAPAKAHSSPRKLNKWVKRKMAKQRLKAEKSSE